MLTWILRHLEITITPSRVEIPRSICLSNGVRDKLHYVILQYGRPLPIFIPLYFISIIFCAQGLVTAVLCNGPQLYVMKRLRTFFQKDVGGQSMRAGGATTLAEHGIAPSIIQATGRWSSEAFLIYIRKHPALIQGLLYANAHTNDNTPGNSIQ